MSGNITIKVVGTEAAVTEFLKTIDATFALVVKGNLKPNDKSSGVHCFVELNPHYTKAGGK